MSSPVGKLETMDGRELIDSHATTLMGNDSAAADIAAVAIRLPDAEGTLV